MALMLWLDGMMMMMMMLQVIICEVGDEAAPMPVASLTQKGWCPRSVCSGSGDVQLVQQLIQRRSSVGGASFACMSSLACGRPGDSALLLACMFGVLLLFRILQCASCLTDGGTCFEKFHHVMCHTLMDCETGLGQLHYMTANERITIAIRMAIQALASNESLMKKPRERSQPWLLMIAQQ
jgi:hypothetical protein